ncbi:hypothetical protein EZS27_002545 [termite gut metagenome]|uniref:Uncharacterized protein n=1 Tax=termite gut metagenome TaxID=433724 RepID=A0A5J4SX88_9ZZZZ
MDVYDWFRVKKQEFLEVTFTGSVLPRKGRIS